MRAGVVEVRPGPFRSRSFVVRTGPSVRHVTSNGWTVGFCDSEL
jgi:hypothetical protein